MVEKCISCIKDSKTGECYEVKDAQARKRLAELELSAGTKLYKHDFTITVNYYENGMKKASFGPARGVAISNVNKASFVFNDSTDPNKFDILNDSIKLELEVGVFDESTNLMHNATVLHGAKYSSGSDALAVLERSPYADLNQIRVIPFYSSNSELKDLHEKVYHVIAVKNNVTVL